MYVMTYVMWKNMMYVCYPILVLCRKKQSSLNMKMISLISQKLNYTLGPIYT